MSIPLGAFTPDPVVAAYLPPLTDDYNPLEMRATGGVAIGDGTQGREIQFWTVSYDGTDIDVADALGNVQFSLTVPGVLAVCLAFDSNMAVTLCYMTASGASLYFYNSLTASYQTNDYPDVSSCRVVVDKTTSFFEGQSDVIFGYVKGDGSTVCWRQQRDRYAIEYTVPAQDTLLLTLENPLIRLGPTDANRLQFEFYVAPPPPAPPVPSEGRILPSLSLQRLIAIENVFD